MKLLNYNILAGWPVSSTVMKYVQEQMLQLQMMSLLGGNFYIVAGCEPDGNGGITDGTVVINGDVLPFEGSALLENAKVIITETVGYKQFFGGNGYNPFYHNKKAQFGTTGNNQTEWLWSSFKRNDPNNGLLARVDKIEKMLKPLLGYTADIDGVPTTVYGSWMFWGRPENEIPAGWEAVPDDEWKGRVPVVFDGRAGDFDFNVIGKTGGERTHLLNVQEIPSHNHPSGSKPSKGRAAGNSFDEMEWRQDAVNPNAPAFTADEWTRPVGGDQAHNNIQPYKVVYFIRFVG